MKNSDKEIIESRERWQLATNISNMGFYDWFPQEDRIIWDSRLHEITGLSPGSKKRRQEYFMSIVHPEDVEEVTDNMARVLDPGSSETKFSNSLRAIVNGEQKYFHTAGIVEKDENGLVNKVFGIVMDTTSKMESELRIRENEERLRVAAEASGFGTFDWLIQENHLYWDQRMHEIFELDQSSTVNRNEHFFSHIHPNDLDRVSRNFEIRMSKESGDATIFDEFRIIVNDDLKYITSHGSISRDKSGQVIRVIGTLFDITHLKRTEQELQKSQQYFKSVFEGNNDHIFTIDNEWKIVFINHVSPGLTRDQVIGTQLIDLESPKDRPKVKKTLNRVFKKGVNDHYNTTYDGPNGTIHYSTQVSPLISDNKVFGATFISRDITKLKESRKILKNKTIELQRSNQNLEQFAYISSHDIKAPITNLESLLKIMDEQKVITEEGQEIFGLVKSTVHRMNQTVKALNEVFFVQSNLNLPKEKLVLEENLNEVLESIDNQIKESGSTISRDFSKAPFINFPAVHLESILQNLVTNSIKYKQDNITPHISITSMKDRSKRQTRIIYEDNGRGMDLEKYGNKVFGLFQRFHLDTEGRGMGLYIIKLIVESYGGEITLESEPDKGVKYNIVL